LRDGSQTIRGTPMPRVEQGPEGETMAEILELQVTRGGVAPQRRNRHTECDRLSTKSRKKKLRRRKASWPIPFDPGMFISLLCLKLV